MKRLLSYTACIISFGIGSIPSAAIAQTTANGPYYATPSWDQTLPSATRFIILSNFGGQAVLDRETGIVWQRSPITSDRNWIGAGQHCINEKTGGRWGWRLPTVQEFSSLFDATPGNAPLPAGLFQNVVSGARYWTATTAFTFDQTNAHVVIPTLSGPDSGLAFDSFGKFGTPSKVWCVRGSQGVDEQ